VSSGTTLATPRGHTTISSRAMDHVISAVAADVLGIAPSDVSVTVSEADDEISLTVRAPNAVIAGAQETVTDETDTVTADAEQRIRTTVRELTGAQIGAATLRLTRTRLRLPVIGD
jgi:hypothetical protein